jgi:hypothetical protein
MKTFKQFWEEAKNLPVDKMSDKVDKLSSELQSKLKSGDIIGASKITDRVGKIKRVVLPPTD